MHWDMWAIMREEIFDVVLNFIKANWNYSLNYLLIPVFETKQS